MTSGLTGHIIKGCISLTPLFAVLGLYVYRIEAGLFPAASLVSLSHKTRETVSEEIFQVTPSLILSERSWGTVRDF